MKKVTEIKWFIKRKRERGEKWCLVIFKKDSPVKIIIESEDDNEGWKRVYYTVVWSQRLEGVTSDSGLICNSR